MNRSSWKIPHVKLSIEQTPGFSKRRPQSEQSRLVIYERSATITPQMLYKAVLVHNGARFMPIRITENHIGFKLGQFVFTKKRVWPKKKAKNKK